VYSGAALRGVTGIGPHVHMHGRGESERRERRRSKKRKRMRRKVTKAVARAILVLQSSLERKDVITLAGHQAVWGETEKLPADNMGKYRTAEGGRCRNRG
jgi:hypothetical protein